MQLKEPNSSLHFSKRNQTVHDSEGAIIWVVLLTLCQVLQATHSSTLVFNFFLHFSAVTKRKKKKKKEAWLKLQSVIWPLYFGIKKTNQFTLDPAAA